MSFGWAFVGFAQTVSPGARLATPLSALGASARADALGDAVEGMGGDPFDLFFDPAGLSQMGNPSLSIHHNSYYAGVFEETLLLGLPAGALGGFAGALQYVSWGGLDERDANGVPQGTFSDSDVALDVGWGVEVLPEFSLGLALRGVQQKIIDSLYTGLSGDFGLYFSPGPDLGLGFSYSGWGTDLSGSAPAQDLRLGISARVPLGKKSGARALLEGDWQPDGVSRLQGGLEGTIERDFFLRVGYQASLSDNQIAGLTGLTAGAGLRLGPFDLDYAFAPDGDLGTSHRVSVGYEFPNPTPVVVRPVTVVAPVTVQGPPVTVVATPPPTPVPVAAPPKSKVEVRFELPGTGPSGTPTTDTADQVVPYEKAAQDHPTDSRAWKNLGIIYLKTGHTALGVQSLEQALRLNPADSALKRWLDDYHAKHPDQP